MAVLCQKLFVQPIIGRSSRFPSSGKSVIWSAFASICTSLLELRPQKLLPLDDESVDCNFELHTQNCSRSKPPSPGRAAWKSLRKPPDGSRHWRFSILPKNNGKNIPTSSQSLVAGAGLTVAANWSVKSPRKFYILLRSFDPGSAYQCQLRRCYHLLSERARKKSICSDEFSDGNFLPLHMVSWKLSHNFHN